MAEVPEFANVLVVAHRTAATPALLAAVRDRAARGRCHFTLLVPNPVAGLGPGERQREWKEREGREVLALALPLLDEAAGDHVDGRVAEDPSPFDAIQAAVWQGDIDEIIFSTLPHRVSHWLHLDLPSRVAALGLPLTVVGEGA